MLSHARCVNQDAARRIEFSSINNNPHPRSGGACQKASCPPDAVQKIVYTMNHTSLNRRNFFKPRCWAHRAGDALDSQPRPGRRCKPPPPPKQPQQPQQPGRCDGRRRSRRHGFPGAQALREQVAAAIGNKRVIIKPNNLVVDRPLAASDAKNLEGILEFLKSIRKTGNVVIAESPAMGSAMTGFANYGYDKLATKYGAKLMDLDQGEYETIYCFDEKNFRPHPCRMAKSLLDPTSFVISAAKFKTRNRVVATLSLKNIVVGAPIKRNGGEKAEGGYLGNSDKALSMAAVSGESTITCSRWLRSCTRTWP